MLSSASYYRTFLVQGRPTIYIYRTLDHVDTHLTYTYLCCHTFYKSALFFQLFFSVVGKYAKGAFFTCALPRSKRLTLVRKSGNEYHSGVSSLTSDRAEVHMSQLRPTLLKRRSATSNVPFFRRKETRDKGGGGGTNTQPWDFRGRLGLRSPQHTTSHFFYLFNFLLIVKWFKKKWTESSEAHYQQICRQRYSCNLAQTTNGNRHG